VLVNGMAIELEATVEGAAVVVPGDVVMVTDEVITVRVRVSREGDVPIQGGTPVTGFVMDKGGVFRFDSVVIKRLRSAGQLEMLLEPPDDMHEERRNYFRFHYGLPVRLRLLGEDDKPGARYFAESLDLAGGGLAVMMGESLESGARVLVRIRLEDPNEAPVEATGHVVRSVEQPSIKAHEYRVAIVFDKIAEADRQRLIQFIFGKQREFRQKGLL
jgi:c-di-GMP-binding flagellar brake protein YcgR